MIAISAQQLKRIQAEDAIIKEKEARERVSEPNTKVRLCEFLVERYTTGSFRGMFAINMMVYKNGKKIELKKVIDGVFLSEAMDAIEKAIDWRVHRMR